MNALTLAALVDHLPPGRTRQRYQRLLAETGGDMMAVTVPYADTPAWFVTGEAQALALTARGIPRWRVWTLREANSILEACGTPAATILDAARLFTSARSH